MIPYCLLRNAARTVSHNIKGPGYAHYTPNRRTATTSAPLSAQHENETFTLANGHTLGFSSCGPPHAPALFFLHGQGSCRLQGLALASNADNIGVRIICPDRPGLGLSTFDPHRKLLDYPSHISQLAKHLGLHTYRVMGGSGGGPYAVACAFALPQTQLKGAAVLAGVGPREDGFWDMRLGTRMLMTALRYTPGLSGAFLDMAIGRKARDPDPEVLKKAFASQMKYLTPVLTPDERQLFEQKPEIVDEIVADFREHFRQGSRGFVRDGQLLVEPWGFRLEDVAFGGVRFYYGSRDINTPARMGRSMAAKMKGAVFKEYEGETHLTLFDNRGDDILRDIMEH